MKLMSLNMKKEDLGEEKSLVCDNKYKNGRTNSLTVEIFTIYSYTCTYTHTCILLKIISKVICIL